MNTPRKPRTRILGAALAVVLTFGCLSVTADTAQILSVEDSAPVCAAGKPQCVTAIRKTASKPTEKQSAREKTPSALPYVADVLCDEVSDILTYAKGEDPNADKPVDKAGQNTKNNVAITLLFLAKNAKAVRSLHFELVPCADGENVRELCIFYKTLFVNDEQTYNTGVLFDYNTETIYMRDGTGIAGIGYDFNFDFNVFSSATDSWQRDFGFCREYDDLAFLIGDVYETIRVPFTYDGKDWMIQIWKGNYSYDMLGAEIGIYNKPADREAAFYDCATDAERLEMGFTVLLDGKEIVTAPSELKWWQTRFTYHVLVNPARLTLQATIRFPNKTMMQAFAESLQAADSSVTCTTRGTTLCFTWPASK